MAAVAALAAKLAKLAKLALKRRALTELLNPLAAANRSVMALLGVGAALLMLAAIVPMLVVVLFAGSAAAGEGGWSKDVPEAYRGMYEAASKEYDVNKYLLAAIHSVETSFGTSNLPGVQSGANHAGAMGPMQFLAGTWAMYDESFEPIKGQRPIEKYPLHRDELASCRGVPTDKGCVYDSFDAIAGAADYLAESGADQDLDSDGTREAVFAYNHSNDYVNQVLTLARKFQEEGMAMVAVDLGEAVAATEPRTLERLKAVANAIDQRTEKDQLPYCWGGGHGSKPGPTKSLSPPYYCWHGDTKVYDSQRIGLDCSGAVRWLLVASGFPDPGGIGSEAYAGYVESGSDTGGDFTLYYNREHIFVEIDGRTWQTSETNQSHGPGWTYSRSAADFTAGHLAGL